MSQAVVASQYGRRSRGPGRVPRAAPRQPGCTVEQTNHEPRSFLALGASRREFQGFHETRVTKHESRLFSVGAPGWRHRKPPSGPLRPPAGHCVPVHHCSLLFAIVRQKKLLRASVPAPPGRPFPPHGHCLPARCGAAMARHGRHIAPRAGVPAPSAVRREIPQKWTESRISERKQEAQRSPRFPSPLGHVPPWRTHNEPMLRKENVLY